MKIVFTETPSTMDQSHEVDYGFLPPEAEHIVAVYNPAEPLDYKTNSKFLEDIRDADIIINSYVEFEKELIDHLEKCKVISFQSTGYNAVDLDYAAKSGV